jgi:3-oxoacid CoA-transferase
LPPTARRAVDLIVTDLAVFSFDEGRLTLDELMPGATVGQVQERTDATFQLGRGIVAGI